MVGPLKDYRGANDQVKASKESRLTSPFNYTVTIKNEKQF